MFGTGAELQVRATTDLGRVLAAVDASALSAEATDCPASRRLRSCRNSEANQPAMPIARPRPRPTACTPVRLVKSRTSATVVWVINHARPTPVSPHHRW
jgi:hypothetical protein